MELGLKWVPIRNEPGDENDARKWEISESFIGPN